MTLILFDIDGTLLRVTGGVHEAAMQAVTDVTGHSGSTEGVAFSGRTDPAIFRDILRASGVPSPDEILEEVIATYVAKARETIRPPDVEVLPGVPALLSALARRDDVYLALVTGNVEPIAYHKLRSGGLSAHFSVGGFGSDHADRAELPPLAVRRASENTGHEFSPQTTVVIGDTRHDVHCARAAGTRAVAVCTGSFGRRELRGYAPDLLLDSLRATDEVIDQILNA